MSAPLAEAAAVVTDERPRLSGPTLIALRGVEARYVACRWPWAEANGDRIAAHWAALKAGNAALFNGRVLLAAGRRFEAGIYRADYFDVGFASFLAWRDFGFPDASVSNGFAMAALRTADGAFLLGIMGSHTANAGRIYFPAGTPDPDDITADGHVDLAGSVLRELAEETGLGAQEVEATQAWTAVVDGARTALMRELRSALPAEALKKRIVAWLRRQRKPELQGIHIARSAADIDPERMPPFMQAFLRDAFARGQC